jgi:hypothetical protein
MRARPSASLRALPLAILAPALASAQVPLDLQMRDAAMAAAIAMAEEHLNHLERMGEPGPLEGSCDVMLSASDSTCSASVSCSGGDDLGGLSFSVGGTRNPTTGIITLFATGSGPLGTLSMTGSSQARDVPGGTLYDTNVEVVTSDGVTSRHEHDAHAEAFRSKGNDVVELTGVHLRMSGTDVLQRKGATASRSVSDRRSSSADYLEEGFYPNGSQRLVADWFMEGVQRDTFDGGLSIHVP